MIQSSILIWAPTNQQCDKPIFSCKITYATRNSGHRTNICNSMHQMQSRPNFIYSGTTNQTGSEVQLHTMNIQISFNTFTIADCSSSRVILFRTSASLQRGRAQLRCDPCVNCKNVAITYGRKNRTYIVTR